MRFGILMAMVICCLGATPTTTTRPTSKPTAEQLKLDLEREMEMAKATILARHLKAVDSLIDRAMAERDLQYARELDDYRREIRPIPETATKPTTPKATIPADAVRANGRHYKAFAGRFTWEEANRKCQTLGGHLATLDTREKNAWAAKYLAASDMPSCVWIGGIYTAGKWQWADGSEMGQTNWPANPPKPIPPIPHDRMVFIEARFAGRSNPAANKWAALPSDHGDVNGFLCEW